ncbi:MAG: hypothetical protein P1V19_23580 [Gimesia sp.]|nr:hypothetical protein [Gimesia sp.]
MPQELTLDQYIQSLKKSRKRNYYLIGLWLFVLLAAYFSSSELNISILWIAFVTVGLAIVAADVTSQDRLIIALKIMNGKSVSQPEPDTAESADQ